MRVALLRHPRVADVGGICYGRTDVDLHRDAIREIDAIAGALGGSGLPVWTSPARRCRILAAAIAARPQPDARLLELDFGAWEGLPWREVPRAALDAWAADPLGFAPPGGETGAALLARVASFHATLRDLGQDAIVVSHGGPLRVLASLLRHQPVDLLRPPPAVGSITWIEPVP